MQLKLCYDRDDLVVMGLTHLVGNQSGQGGWWEGSLQWLAFAGARWRSSPAPLGPAARTAGGRVKISSLLYQTQETNTRTQPTCTYIIWITSTPKLAATAKSERLVTTMQVENMPNHSHLALSEWQKKNNKILYTAAIAAAHIENHSEKRLVQTINIILSHKWKWYEVLSLKNSGPEGK